MVTKPAQGRRSQDLGVSLRRPTGELKSTGKGEDLPAASPEAAKRLLLLGEGLALPEVSVFPCLLYYRSLEK